MNQMAHLATTGDLDRLRLTIGRKMSNSAFWSFPAPIHRLGSDPANYTIMQHHATIEGHKPLTLSQLTDMLKLVYHEKPSKLTKQNPLITRYLISEC